MMADYQVIGTMAILLIFVAAVLGEAYAVNKQEKEDEEFNRIEDAKDAVMKFFKTYHVN